MLHRCALLECGAAVREGYWRREREFLAPGYTAHELVAKRRLPTMRGTAPLVLLVVHMQLLALAKVSTRILG